MLAYFGYPAAHEDDAERAVRAGLALLEHVGAVNAGPGVTLQARIGVASGVVVVGDLVREGMTQENAVIGETTNLAARLQSLAEPNTIVISPETYRLVQQLFEYRDLGPHSLKGFAEPVNVRQVLGASKVESRFEALHPSGGLPLLGRKEELELLVRRWEQAKGGEGRVVLVTGEPGIGKSRLTRALQERLAAELHTPLIYHCSPYHKDSAHHPIMGQLLRAAAIERDDGAETKLDKLEALLAHSSENLAEDVPLFAVLLSIPSGDRYPLPNLTPQRLKERTLAALLAHLRCLAARRPLLMIFEDLHWIDPTSLELLSLVVDQAPGLRLLLIATSRPEFVTPWARHHHISTVSLGHLGPPEGQALVEGVAKGKALPPEVVDKIIARTDGVPLFIEELTKTVLESGLLREAGNRYELTGPLPPIAIPSTLHASLLARLDRLASVKDVAQIGAAIGREFSYGLIAAVSALAERDLQVALARLVGAELIFQRGAPPDATFLFKHTLVQETVQASLVRSRRTQLHGKIARALEERRPDIIATEPQIVAHHFTEAGLTRPAIEYWRRAGEHFLRRPAYIEAVTHFTRAIEMLKAMPDTPDTLGEELEILIKMVPALIAAKGPGSVELEALYLRARGLVDRLEKTSLRFPVLWGLWFLKYTRGQYAAALEVGERLLDSAQTGGDTGQILEAHHALWALLSVMGQAADAVCHMERGMALYDRALHASHASLYAGHDPGACCRYHLAKDLWLLGHHDRSMSALVDALRLAEELKHPITSVVTLSFAAWVYHQRGDRTATRKLAERMLALGTKHEHWAGDVAIILLSADARLGKQALAELDSRLQTAGRMANWWRAFCLCLLAELYGEGGHAEDGLALLGSIPTEDRGGFYSPEILRLEGELRRRVPSPDIVAIERCFQAAHTLARERAAKSLELRAATSLARLWRDQGRRVEALGLLKPVYDWFTEGLDLRDLKNARALIDDLTLASAGEK